MSLKTKLILFICVAAVLFAPVKGQAEIVDKVIVVVNEEVITQREFDRAFLPLKKQYEESFKGQELEKRVEGARKGILEQLINSKLAISLAKKQKVKIDEVELQERIDKVKAFYGNEDAFRQALNDKGTNLTEFEREIREQMLAQRLVEQEISSKIVITPGELRDLYGKNKDQLISPKMVKVRGILTRKQEDPKADEEAKKKIKKILAQAKKGKDFSTLAIEESEGPYAKNGGEMGLIAPGQTLKEIDDTVFAMQKGEISDVVETRIGYHIFLVEDTQEAKNLEFEEVSDFLREQLRMKKFKEELVLWLDAKRKDAYISYK